MWQFLQNELSSVQKEIEEWRNTMDSWHQHCQVLCAWDCSAFQEYVIAGNLFKWGTNPWLIFFFLQVIMKACSGIDYREFASFLKIIAENRMAILNTCSSGDSSDYSQNLSETLTTLGPYHAAFDLQRVAHITECLLCNEDFKRLDHSASTLQLEIMLQQIRDTIQSTRGQHLLYQE